LHTSRQVAAMRAPTSTVLNIHPCRVARVSAAVRVVNAGPGAATRVMVGRAFVAEAVSPADTGGGHRFSQRRGDKR